MENLPALGVFLVLLELSNVLSLPPFLFANFAEPESAYSISMLTVILV